MRTLRPGPDWRPRLCPGCGDRSAGHDRAACCLASARAQEPDWALAELYRRSTPLACVAEALGVGELAVLEHLRRRAMIPGLLIRTGLPWSETEARTLRAEYEDCDVPTLAAALCRSVGSVEREARRLGLRRSRWSSMRHGDSSGKSGIAQVRYRPDPK